MRRQIIDIIHAHSEGLTIKVGELNFLLQS